MEINKKQHWENVFATKKETEVSWYQEKPETSLQFFERNNIPKTAKILEIGGGDSYLIDNLLLQDYESLTLLDISENAIERIKKRLGEKSEKVRFVVSDILDFSSIEKFDVIHDRASFHFLTKDEDIQKYATLMNDILKENGLYFVGTFSESGPLKCSGLEITQYSKEKFLKIFGNDFSLLHSFEEVHKTPFETTQNFIFCEFQKKM
ncbi:class I SAM-dependent methyltransferase [Cloacibacterium normanense]|uniref:Methyltransferase domain protein n=1 Tax=Cloacibacterium normanense TaxID=237258 RepID=A0A1E5UEJ3_9FLAO|nr:class I SAM-dependent methyltransferase [Cloacibacterium normanense]AZI69146.1 class I SAM-dependent methyltransferase [Cloacibacterium normanense]OEL11343.1 methyltransferase domain protein [Cloacibacterium normanense]SDO14317.1 Methyltransferase domain-containing protein [Cloacibacterium normanense]